jgi:PPOX class probable F420-dependent enzyme
VKLTTSEIDGFLSERHTVIVATLNRDGTPHLTTTWYRWDGTSFWIATNRTTRKFKNLERDPRLTLLVDAPERETSVSAQGQAEVVARDEDAWDGALLIVGRYVSDAQAYLEARRDQPRVLIRMTPTRMVSWRPD